MDLMIDHGYIQRQSWAFKRQCCVHGGMRCVLITEDASFAQIMAWAAFPSLASSRSLSMSLGFVSSCRRYVSLRGSVATHGQVFLGNQLQTTQRTASDEAWWAVVYRECFEREWRGSLATRSLLLSLYFAISFFTDKYFHWPARWGFDSKHSWKRQQLYLGLYSDCFLRSAFHSR